MILKTLITTLLATSVATATFAQTLPEIQVSANHRFLQTPDGKPFYWLGDTDWELFHRLTREEAAEFLDIRRQQGFNVIQAVALAEFDGIRTPNRYGDKPLRNDADPLQWATTPGQNPANAGEYDYWDHVEYIIKTAAQKGLYIGLLPTWGDKVAHLWGDGPRIINVANARAYGKLMGQRFGKYNVIWILGGDRPATYTGSGDFKGQAFDDRPIWRAMAEGIIEGVGHKPFLTYHPAGGARSTSQYMHDEPWLDMNAFQSGHGSREADAWNWVKRDLALTPPKPTLDMEPCYEDHPVNPWDGKWTRQRGYFTAYDVRARVYRGLFAGACGVTYGHHHIWQFMNKALYAPVNVGDTIIPWRQAARAEAATQMIHLKRLLLSRPYFSRIPDQSLIVSENPDTYQQRIEATRDASGSYALVYLPQNRPVTLNLSALSGNRLRVHWFDPRTGRATPAGNVAKSASQTFTPPATGQDWVLVLDDEGAKAKAPGAL